MFIRAINAEASARRYFARSRKPLLAGSNSGSLKPMKALFAFTNDTGQKRFGKLTAVATRRSFQIG
jgi:hypothetical protein